MRIGAKLPNSGDLPLEYGIPAMAKALEDAGFDSVWVSDHVAMPRSVGSNYPFAADGQVTWPTDSPYIEALVALALAVASTERVALGTAVLILPLRNPVMFAKQAASIDVASGGRLALGVGAGWLKEEFDALDVSYADRGSRFAEWIQIARNCWTGAPDAYSSDRYELPADMLCLPRPAHEIPLLVGGHSEIALKRAGRIGDGWLGQQSLDELDLEELGRAYDLMRSAAEDAGRDRDRLTVVLRIVDSAGRDDDLRAAIPDLEAVGVDEVIVDLLWDGAKPVHDLTAVRAGLGS